MTEAGLDGIEGQPELGGGGARGVLVSLGAQSIRFVLQFGSQILLARLLTPADFGLVAMAIPVLMLAQTLGELGLAQAIIQRPNLTSADMSLLFWLSLPINGALSALMLVTAPLVAWLYGQPQLTAVLVVLAALPVLNGIGAQQMAFMARNMHFARMAAIDIVCLGTAIAIGLAGALAGWGLWSLVAMQISNMVVIALLATIMSGWLPGRSAGARGVRPMLAFGAHQTGFNLLSYAGSYLDSVTIGAVSGAVGLGLYDRSMKLITTPITQVNMPFARVATGLLSRLQAAPAAYRAAYLGMLQGFLAATAPAFACGALMAGTLVPFALGEQWEGAVPVVACLCVSAMFIPFGLSTSWLFISQGRVAAQLRWAGLRTGLSLAALAAGLPWGVVGVAVAYAAAAPLVQGAMVWGAVRQGPVGWRDILAGTYPVLVSIVVGVGVAALVMAWLPLQGAAIRLLVCLGLIYVCGLASLMCFSAGRTLLRGAFRIAGRR